MGQFAINRSDFKPISTKSCPNKKHRVATWVAFAMLGKKSPCPVNFENSVDHGGREFRWQPTVSHCLMNKLNCLSHGVLPLSNELPQTLYSRNKKPLQRIDEHGPVGHVRSECRDAKVVLFASLDLTTSRRLRFPLTTSQQTLRLVPPQGQEKKGLIFCPLLGPGGRRAAGRLRIGKRGQVLNYKFFLTPADRCVGPAPDRSWRTQ